MKSEPGTQKESFKSETHTEKKKKYVYPVRDWKEYLGESFLIVFSVLLALALTEYINKMHDRENTKSIMISIVDELNRNKVAISEMQKYNLFVLARIDSVLTDKKKQKKFISKGEIHLDMIAPEGVLYRYLEDEAWTVAKSNNIMSRIDIEAITLLTRVYGDQDRINKMEGEVAKIILDRQSRETERIRTTLILIRDNYHAWAVDRIPGLLAEIDAAILKIDKSVKAFSK
jgi:hypothetical protein